MTTSAATPLFRIAPPDGSTGARVPRLHDDEPPLTRREDEEAAGFPVVRVLEGAAPEPVSVQIDELLIDQDINLWAGYGASAKSVLVERTAVSVALGDLPVFGTLNVQRAGPVLLVLPEDGERGARMMLDAIVEGLSLSANDRATLRERLIMVPDSIGVDITRDVPRLARTAREHEAVLVILDPLRNLLGGAAENDNDVAGAVCDRLRRELCWGAGATVLMTHHNRKPGKEAFAADTAPSIHDMRGGGGWGNGSRLVFGVGKKGSRITMTGLKTNRLRPDLRHELTLEIEADPENAAHWLTCRVFDSNAGATSAALTPGIGRQINDNERAALLALDDRHEPGKRWSWSGWKEGSGLNPNTFKSIKDRMLEAGLASAVPTGHKTRTGGTEYAYTITPAGRRALESGWATERGYKG